MAGWPGWPAGWLRHLLCAHPRRSLACDRAGACKFDLRFVPEGESFAGRQVRDAATDVPADYEPPNFQTKVPQRYCMEGPEPVAAPIADSLWVGRAGLHLGRRGRGTATGSQAVPRASLPPPPAQALQHTRPTLTWDADDGGRKKALSKRLTAEELKDDDFKVLPGVLLVLRCRWHCGDLVLRVG